MDTQPLGQHICSFKLSKLSTALVLPWYLWNIMLVVAVKDSCFFEERSIAYKVSLEHNLT